MIFTLIFLFFGFVFSNEVLHIFEKDTLWTSDFFYINKKNSWGELKESEKSRRFDDFIKKELVYQEALSLGLHSGPFFKLKLKEREKQLLVNNFYERFVALPLVEQNHLDFIYKNISKEVFVYHLLVGFNGSALSDTIKRTKTQALDLLLKTKKDIDKNPSVDFFKKTALVYSEDPSVINNSGSLGWVSLGKTVPSFQEGVFNTVVGGVSDPILTPYGYHLVFIEKERPSDFAYYKKGVMFGFADKVALQSLDFEILKEAAATHDSLLLSQGSLKLNASFVDTLLHTTNSVFSSLGLRGGKKNYLDVFSGEKFEKGVLFVFNGKGYGLGWLSEKLKKTPSTRVPVLKNLEDFKNLISNYLIQDNVYLKAKDLQLKKHPFVQTEIKENFKGLVFKEYLNFKKESLSAPDSLVVKKAYSVGLEDSLYFDVEKVILKEFKTYDEKKADFFVAQLKKGVSFDSLLFLHSPESVNKKKFINKGSKGFLGEVAFSLKENTFSEKISNADKSFSVLFCVGFLPSSPFSLNDVYKKIEKNILKEKEDSIKTFLLQNLKDRFSFIYNYKDLK